MESITSLGDEVWIHHAYGPVVAWDLSAPNAPPRVCSPTQVAEQHPEVALALAHQDTTRRNSGLSVAHANERCVTLDLAHDHSMRWFADGEWRVHDLAPDGMLIASCWNQIAFLQLHDGKRCAADGAQL